MCAPEAIYPSPWIVSGLDQSRSVFSPVGFRSLSTSLGQEHTSFKWVYACAICASHYKGPVNVSRGLAYSQLIHFPLTTIVINPTTTQNSDAAASLISLLPQTLGVFG